MAGSCATCRKHSTEQKTVLKYLKDMAKEVQEEEFTPFKSELIKRRHANARQWRTHLLASEGACLHNFISDSLNIPRRK